MALPEPSPSPTPQPVSATVLAAFTHFNDWIADIQTQNQSQQMKYSDAVILLQGIRDILHASGA